MNSFGDFDPIMMNYEDLFFPFLRSHGLDAIAELIFEYKYQLPKLSFGYRLPLDHERSPSATSVIAAEMQPNGTIVATTIRFCIGVTFYETRENDTHRIIFDHHQNVNRSRFLRDIKNLGKVEWFNWYPLYQNPRPENLEHIFPQAKYVLLHNGFYYPVYRNIDWFSELVGKRLRKSFLYDTYSRYHSECCYCGYSTFSHCNPYHTAGQTHDLVSCHHYCCQQTSVTHRKFYMEVVDLEAQEDVKRRKVAQFEHNLSRIYSQATSSLGFHSHNVVPTLGTYPDEDHFPSVWFFETGIEETGDEDEFQLAQADHEQNLAMKRADNYSTMYARFYTALIKELIWPPEINGFGLF